MKEASWMEVATEGSIIFIVDLCEPARPSITNDAEEVVRKLNEKYPGYRIMYRDSMNRWDELVHRNGVFKTFAPGFGHGKV